ncbi:MAG: beta-lactamase family protein [Alphaproteobacteria bacterium]|nr:beta-lactamase family protein [Alphaproteobacteria bacterium]
MGRLRFSLLLAALALAGCGTGGKQAEVEAAAGTRLAAMGLARSLPDGTSVVLATGCARIAADGHSCIIAFTADSPVRIASISKLVTLIGALRLAEAGEIDLDADVSSYLKFPLRNPAFPDRPITLRQLFAHTSGLRDGDDFVIPLGGKVADTMLSPEHWDPASPPGAYFTYSNLGIIVAATAMEGATGERFDRLMARLVFRPLGLTATYNWSGADNAAAERAATLYRTAGDDEVWHPDGPFLPQVDDRDGALPDCPAPVIAPGFTCNMDVYPPGTNAGIFSPQGGLRISLNELMILARLLADGGTYGNVRLLKPETLVAASSPAWMLDRGGRNGMPDHGTMCAYGTGIHLLGAAPGPHCADNVFNDTGTRFGHAAEAYGLLGGLWIEPASAEAIVYLATGTSTNVLEDRGPHSGFTRLEETLAAAAAALQAQE